MNGFNRLAQITGTYTHKQSTVSLRHGLIRLVALLKRKLVNRLIDINVNVLEESTNS